MIRLFWIILIVGLLAPRVVQAGQEEDESGKGQVQQAPGQDPAVNRQILQTLADIRDSQLSVLQAQVEILSILRSQAKTPAATAAHDPAPDSSHHAAARKKKPKPTAQAKAANDAELDR
jgi:hypothetical protein